VSSNKNIFYSLWSYLTRIQSQNLQHVLAWRAQKCGRVKYVYVYINDTYDRLQLDFKVTSPTSSPYWYAMECEIWGNSLQVIMCVTLCYHPMKPVISRVWKYQNLKWNCFVYYEQFDLSEKVKPCIYHIIKYSWHGVSPMWPVMWILQVSHEINRVSLSVNSNFDK
jgi:hypothetical protein